MPQTTATPNFIVGSFVQKVHMHELPAEKFYYCFPDNTHILKAAIICNLVFSFLLLCDSYNIKNLAPEYKKGPQYFLYLLSTILYTFHFYSTAYYLHCSCNYTHHRLVYYISKLPRVIVVALFAFLVTTIVCALIMGTIKASVHIYKKYYLKQGDGE